MTNGEKLKEIFPNIEFTDTAFTIHAVTAVTLNGVNGHISYDFWKYWWNAEYKEPTTKNDLGVDAVSRQQAIERLKLNFPISDGADNSRDRHRYMQALADIQAIRELPSVTPQEPTGKKFTKADIDAIVKAINTGWELRVNEILDKIRAEIDKARFVDKDTRICKNALASGLEVAMQIIDKYKAETEVDNGNN